MPAMHCLTRSGSESCTWPLWTLSWQSCRCTLSHQDNRCSLLLPPDVAGTDTAHAQAPQSPQMPMQQAQASPAVSSLSVSTSKSSTKRSPLQTLSALLRCTLPPQAETPRGQAGWALHILWYVVPCMLYLVSSVLWVHPCHCQYRCNHAKLSLPAPEHVRHVYQAKSLASLVCTAAMDIAITSRGPQYKQVGCLCLKACVITPNLCSEHW